MVNLVFCNNFNHNNYDCKFAYSKFSYEYDYGNKINNTRWTFFF